MTAEFKFGDIVGQAEAELARRFKADTEREIVLSKEHAAGLRDFVGTLINPTFKGRVFVQGRNVDEQLENLHQRLNLSVLEGVKSKSHKLPLVVHGTDITILSTICEDRTAGFLRDLVKMSGTNVRGLVNKYKWAGINKQQLRESFE